MRKERIVRMAVRKWSWFKLYYQFCNLNSHMTTLTGCENHKRNAIKIQVIAPVESNNQTNINWLSMMSQSTGNVSQLSLAVQQ